MQAALEELRTLHAIAKQEHVKTFLSAEIQRLEREIIRQNCENPAQDAPPRPTQPQRSRTKIDLYGWGQSGRFLNLYISDKLKELKGLPAENVTSTFTDRSCQLEIKDLNGRDYFFTITNLCEAIVPEESNHKLKTDSIVLNLRKKVEKEWPCVTATEKALKDKKKEKEDQDAKELKSQDPQAGLMGMMKKMYDEGDDDMKRTIKKAWSESQSKQQAGLGGGGLDSM